MIEVTKSEREEVVSRCANFLGEVWRRAKNEDIECRRITSGVANKTFHVSIKTDKDLQNNNEIENNDVIVRFYNSGLFKNQSKLKFNGEAAEAIVHQMLFEVGLTSKLLGVFDGGRIEKFIPSRPTTADDLKSVELSKEVIRKVAKFHTLAMPVSKKPNMLEKVAVMVSETVVAPNYIDKYPNEVEECKLIMEFPFAEELLWIQAILPIVGHKVVFSHNDLNPNNILMKENPENDDDKLFLVDYEMCTYFYRAYDLAYFLRLKRSRVQMCTNKIMVTFDEEDNSASDALLQEYLNECKKLAGGEFDPKYDNLEYFRMEVAFFDLVLDLFIIGMSRIMIAESLIPFPLTHVGKSASGFADKKKMLIQKFGDPLKW